MTGAGGFAGGHLLDLLTESSTPIIGWHRPNLPPSNPRPGIQWMAIEMLDRRAVAEAVADIKPSAIYHLAGAAHVADSWTATFDTYQGNVLATHHLLDAVRDAAIQCRVLIAGSATVYLPQDRPIHEADPLGPRNPYAISKLAQEMLGRHAWEDDRVPVLLARAFNHVGPRQDPSYVAPGIARQIALIEAGRQDAVLRLGNLTPKRDLSDVRDTVRAYAAMMTSARPGIPYNVCSGNGLSIGALVETFTSRARCDVKVVQDPSRFRPNDTPLLVGDHRRLTADTGWRPEIPFGQTVDDLLEYWRSQIQ